MKVKPCGSRSDYQLEPHMNRHNDATKQNPQSVTTMHQNKCCADEPALAVDTL
jgi:hypothetical protein